MQRHISTRPLTDEEWQEIEEVLLDEIDIQSWYGIAVVSVFAEEVLIPIQ